MLDIKDKEKAALVEAMDRLLKTLVGPENLDELLRILNAKESSGLSLADWGDAFVMAMNEAGSPDKALYNRVKIILEGANEADCGNISVDEIDRALAALEVGLGL